MFPGRIIARVTGWIITTVLLIVQPTAGEQSAAATLRVAAASDLQSVLPEIVARFEKDTGARVSVSFGSSGTFFAQIVNGAPFDLFFSADLDYPTRLVADGHADKDTLYQYATGRIVVWTRDDAPFPIEAGLSALLDPRVRRVAVANPEVAPYGRAAVAALRQAQLYDKLQSRLVFGDNISQTAQLVESGNADAGILALSLALGPALSASGRYVEIPAAAHPPIDQGVVVIAASTHKATARALIAFIKRSDISQLLQHFGFGAAR